MNLDIGERFTHDPEWKTLDIVPPADFIIDLEQGDLSSVGYESWDKIRAKHVLEHIHNLLPLMDELWKLLKPNGTLEIEVPQFPFASAVIDPTHVRFFVPLTFDYFTKRKQFKYVKHYWEYEQEPVGDNWIIKTILKKKV